MKLRIMAGMMPIIITGSMNELKSSSRKFSEVVWL